MFHQGFDEVPARSGEAFLGQVMTDSALRRYKSGINSNPQAAEVWTLTVDSDPGARTDDTISFDFGRGACTVTFSFDAGETEPTIAAIIAAAVQAEPAVYGWVGTQVSGNDVIFTGRTPGSSFELTEAESYLSVVNTTNAAAASDIEVGRAVCVTGVNQTPGNPRRSAEADYLVALASESLFTAQVQTLTVDTGAAVDMMIRIIEIRGSERIVVASDSVVGNATAATQATTIRDAINAIAPANTVVATGAGADIICTAEIAGYEFEVEVMEAGVSSVDTTPASRATSLHRAWGGVSVYTLADEAATIGATTGRYPANAGVRWLQEGQIAVESSESLSFGDTVYVELAAGANAGKLYASAGADRVALSKRVATWERRTHDGLAFGLVNLTHQGL